MIDKRRLLKDHKLWPMEQWNRFDFVHQSPNDSAEERRQIEILRKAVANASGLYAYSKDSRWIYVGKANPLFNRLKSHYRESYKPVPGDTASKLWHRFFSARAGRLTIYWREVDDETDRQIFELAIQDVLKPEFEVFRREGEIIGRRRRAP